MIADDTKTEGPLDLVLNSAPIGSSITDGEGTILHANACLCDILGLPLDKLVGSNAADYWIDLKQRETILAHLGEGGRVRDEPVVLRHANGATVDVLLTLQNSEINGHPAIFGWFYDVTERKRAEDRFRALLESAPDATVIVDSSARIVQANRQATLLFGYPAGDFVGQTVEILLPERMRAQHVGRRDGFFADPRVRPMGEGLELLGLARDGREFPIEISLSPIETDDGLLVSAAVRDVSARVAAEKALRHSQQLTAAILDNSPVGIAFTKQSEAGVAFANSRMAELFGMSADEYLATPIEDFYPDPADYEAIVGKLRGEVAVNGEEVRQRRKDGTEFWASISLVPTKFSGEFGWIAVIQDITKRRDAENDLKEAKQRLDLALEGSEYGLWDWDIPTGTLYFDAQWARITGHAPGDLNNVIETWRELAHPDDTRRISEQNPVERRSDKTFEHEVRLRHTDGRWVWTLSRGRVVARDPQGEPVRIIGTMVDMSPRKSAEEEIRQAKQRAEEALADLKTAQDQLVKTEKMASLGQLTAGIAHEIKNPLNFINNFSETSVELLEELQETLADVSDQIEKDAREDMEETVELLSGDLQKISNHGKRADGIVKSMLLHARGDTAERVPVRINDLVREAYNLAYHGERARDKAFNVTMRDDYDDSAGELSLVPQEVTRVLVNLLSNAFYAMTEKRRELADGTYEPVLDLVTTGHPDAVEIRIRDNGTGIPESVRQKLFDPFFTTKPTGSGTGLGLSMSFDIVVQQHGGRLDVTSQPGDFTEFVIRLPRTANDQNRAN